MKFFVDTAEIDDIAELNDLGMVDGVTTNPSLIKKSGRDIIEVTKEICDLVDGPVSAEVTATDADTMIAEGRKLVENRGKHRGEGSLDLGWPESLQNLVRRRSHGQRDAVFLCQSGAFGSQGWRDIHLSVYRTSG